MKDAQRRQPQTAALPRATKQRHVPWMHGCALHMLLKPIILTYHRESSHSCRCKLVSMQMNGEDAQGHKPLASGIPCVGGDSQMHRPQAVKKITDEQIGPHCGPQEFHH